MEKYKKEDSTLSRREFIKLTGATAVTLTLGSTLAFPQTSQAEKVTFLEHSCGNANTLDGKILVAYGSKCGSTGEVAKAIGKTVCESGAAVDVKYIKNVANLTQYKAVIVGSAIRMGKWLPDVVRFVKTSRQELSQMPVAYFLCCYTMRNPSKENRQKVLSYLDPVYEAIPEVKPVSVGLFAGVVDYSKLSWIFKRILKKKGVEEGDFRDWNAIRSWTVGLRTEILNVHKG